MNAGNAHKCTCGIVLDRTVDGRVAHTTRFSLCGFTCSDSRTKSVKRGLCVKPTNWEWSSFRHCATGFEGIVQIESEWTARKRERAGITLTVRQPPESST